MLFNSYPFIFIFLPIAFAGFFAIAAVDRRLAALWMFAASLFFYGWWNPRYVVLLVASIAFNYAVGRALVKTRRKRVLAAGIAANLLLLGYFKYADFFIENANAVSGARLPLAHVILPLGISFFTFTQIAFLVDSYTGEACEYDVIHYGLFVTYFPHLIAGPILHHREMMPQFDERSTYRIRAENVAIGLTMFFFGLFKKVVFADGAAPYADTLFRALGNGAQPTLLECWAGVLAYTLQIYFDFSGYSDMAIGLSRLFGIRLPLNFNSPYKAHNIIDFWRRWHMTLSRFIRDYLFTPLALTLRGSTFALTITTLVTMTLVGLWHGAAWTFVIWGALHGIYLIVNYAWQSFRRHSGSQPRPLTIAFARATTLIAVMLAWVFFRATSVREALHAITEMTGLHGITLQPGWIARLGPKAGWLTRHGVHAANLTVFNDKGALVLTLALLLAIALFAPNTQEIIPQARPDAAEGVATRRRSFAWSPTGAWAVVAAGVACAALIAVSNVSPFIYFRF
jgi:D-alanyl-lipoteichoic acid acyltransferase DltB (MBOAT superfamily)